MYSLSRPIAHKYRGTICLTFRSLWLSLVYRPGSTSLLLAIEQILQQAKEDADKVNEPIVRRLKQLDETEKKQRTKFEALIATVDTARDPDVKAMIEAMVHETEAVFSEVRAERAELQGKLADVTITDEFIALWRNHSEDIREGANHFTFEERREHIEALNITGTLAFEDEERILYIHLYSYTERIPFDKGGDHLATESVIR